MNRLIVAQDSEKYYFVEPEGLPSPSKSGQGIGDPHLSAGEDRESGSFDDADRDKLLGASLSKTASDPNVIFNVIRKGMTVYHNTFPNKGKGTVTDEIYTDYRIGQKFYSVKWEGAEGHEADYKDQDETMELASELRIDPDYVYYHPIFKTFATFQVAKQAASSEILFKREGLIVCKSSFAGKNWLEVYYGTKVLGDSVTPDQAVEIVDNLNPLLVTPQTQEEAKEVITTEVS